MKWWLEANIRLALGWTDPPACHVVEDLSWKKEPCLPDSSLSGSEQNESGRLCQNVSCIQQRSCQMRGFPPDNGQTSSRLLTTNMFALGSATRRIKTELRTGDLLIIRNPGFSRLRSFIAECDWLRIAHCRLTAESFIDVFFSAIHILIWGTGFAFLSLLIQRADIHD